MSGGYEAGRVVADRAAGGAAVLASDADRDAVASQLGAALAEGRLTAGEHGDRLEIAYAARTVAALAELTADLPGLAADASARSGAEQDTQVRRCLVRALLIFCPPAGICWLLARRRDAREARELGGARAEDR